MEQLKTTCRFREVTITEDDQKRINRIIPCGHMVSPFC